MIPPLLPVPLMCVFISEITAGKKTVSLPNFSLFMSLPAPLQVQFVASVLRKT